jgi:uroporphyrin-3 C-methyltransferase
MSDSSVPPPTADTGEARPRLVAYSRKESTAWGPLVLVLVLLIPLAAAGWVAWRQVALQSELAALRAEHATLQQLNASSTNQFAQVEQRQEELAEAMQQSVAQALQQQVVASNAAAAAQAEQLAALESELAATRLRLNSMEGGGSPLTEAEVLLRFAQQRLVMARDTTSAIELFQSADTLLRDIVDPAVVNVRESLAREVATLQALPTVDVAGLFAQLSAQAARVETFTVVSDATVQDFSVVPAAAETAEPSGWWSGVKQAFGAYFVVSRSNGAALPQLSTNEQYQLRALVQLHIEQAKVALLRGDARLYQSALEDTLVTSRRWLRSDDGSFDDFTAALATLRDTPIVVDIPAVDQTLNSLRRLSGSNGQQSATEQTAQ